MWLFPALQLPDVRALLFACTYGRDLPRTGHDPVPFGEHYERHPD